MNRSSHGSRSTDYANTKEVMDKTSRFLKFEGRVLRFQCVEVKTSTAPFFPELQERAEQEGYNDVVASADIKRYALSFYLGTCDIDLVVQKMKNAQDGQDEPKLVLKKSKLPTNWREARAGRAPKYFEAEDFKCGEAIDVYGKFFLLVNCDSFTRRLYDTLGAPQVDVRLISEPKREVVQPSTGRRLSSHRLQRRYFSYRVRHAQGRQRRGEDPAQPEPPAALQDRDALA
jgi:hypothetical protein